jgi:predicted nucleic acid-binding protein
MSVVVNNTVISNFAVAEKLSLLKQILGKIYITPEVLEEIEDGIKEGHLFLNAAKKAIDEDNWIFVAKLKGKELYMYKILSNKMGIGESSCLSIAYTRKWSFFSDDKTARNYAEKNNIAIGGTFGLLISANDDGILSKYQANEILQVMRKNRYRSPYPDIDSYYKSKIR